MVEPGRLQNLIFTAGVTAASRYFRLRDRLTGRTPRPCETSTFAGRISRISVRSGRHVLDSVLTQPQAGSEILGALLICHGIGETVEHWSAVGRLLADKGITSLVFDYAGYGRSTGRVSATQCEADAAAAWDALARSEPGKPLSLLGFSLGSGVACALLSHVPARQLILCAAFTSFRDAAWRLCLPPMLAPAIWNNEAALNRFNGPVLLLHGERDPLFPPAMARRLERACAGPAKLIVVPELNHEDPYSRPDSSYWDEIVAVLRFTT